MPDLTTKQETKNDGVHQSRKPTAAQQLAVRNEQIENSTTFDPTKQFVNASVQSIQSQTATPDVSRTREQNLHHNIERQTSGVQSRKKKRSIESDPEFASIHTIMLAAMRAAQNQDDQTVAPQKMGLEVTGLEVSNVARAVVKEMVSRGLPLELNVMQDALGQALASSNTPKPFTSPETQQKVAKELARQVELENEREVQLKQQIQSSIIGPLFDSAPDPSTKKHKELLLASFQGAVQLGKDIGGKQLKVLVEAVYNDELINRIAQITSLPSAAERLSALSEYQVLTSTPIAQLERQAPWLFKHPGAAAAILAAKQELVASRLEMDATKSAQSLSGDRFDIAWNALCAQAEMQHSDIFTQQFRATLNQRRVNTWENAERRVRLENEVELTLRSFLADGHDILDHSYIERKERLLARLSGPENLAEFNAIASRIESAFVAKKLEEAARDPFNPENAFGRTILQSTPEQFASAFPALASSTLQSKIIIERRNAGLAIVSQGLSDSALTVQDAKQREQLSTILAAQCAPEVFALFPALELDPQFLPLLEKGVNTQLTNRIAVQVAATALVKAKLAATKDQPFNLDQAACGLNKELAPSIIAKFHTLDEQVAQVTNIVGSFEVSSRSMPIRCQRSPHSLVATEGREEKLAKLKLELQKRFPELNAEAELLQNAIDQTIAQKRKEEEETFYKPQNGKPTMSERVTLFYDGLYGTGISLGGGTSEEKLLQALEGLSPYGIEVFRRELLADKRTHSTPEALRDSELNDYGSDAIWRERFNALLNADSVTSAEILLFPGSESVNDSELRRFLYSSTPELRMAVGQRVNESRAEGALFRSVGNYENYLKFSSSILDQTSSTLHAAITTGDSTTTQAIIHDLSAADREAANLGKALSTQDPQQIVAAAQAIAPSHIGMMRELFFGALGEHIYLAVKDPHLANQLAERFNVQLRAPTTNIGTEVRTGSALENMSSTFDNYFHRSWRDLAQDTKDKKMMLVAAGDEVGLSLTRFHEIVGSFQIKTAGITTLRNEEVGELISIFKDLRDRGLNAQFKESFIAMYGQEPQAYIKAHIMAASTHKVDYFHGETDSSALFHEISAKLLSDAELTAADKLILAMNFSAYRPADIPTITEHLPPEKLVQAVKEFSKRNLDGGVDSIVGYSLQLGEINNQPEEIQLALCSQLLFSIYQARYASELTDDACRKAKQSFRGAPDLAESVRRLRENAEYQIDRLYGDSNFSYNPLTLFNTPSVLVNKVSSTDDQLNLDASFALKTARSLEERLRRSEEERLAFQVFAQLHNKESLTAEETKKAQNADRILKSYLARVSAMPQEELALLTKAQSQLESTGTAYGSMRQSAAETITTIGEVGLSIALIPASGGTSVTLIITNAARAAALSTGVAFGTRLVVKSSILGADYTEDAMMGDLGSSMALGASQFGAVTSVSLFRGLATKAVGKVVAKATETPAIGAAVKAVDTASAKAAEVAAKVEAKAAQETSRITAQIAKVGNGSKNVVVQLVSDSVKHAIEWGSVGGVAGGLNSAIHLGSSGEFWREHGFLDGMRIIAQQAGGDAVASAIFSASLGATFPTTRLVSRSIFNIRQGISNKISEARREILKTFEETLPPHPEGARFYDGFDTKVWRNIESTPAKPSSPIDVIDEVGSRISSGGKEATSQRVGPNDSIEALSPQSTGNQRSLDDQMVFFDEAGNLTMRPKSAQPTEVPNGVGTDGEMFLNPGPRTEPINPKIRATSEPGAPNEPGPSGQTDSKSTSKFSQSDGDTGSGRIRGDSNDGTAWKPDSEQSAGVATLEPLPTKAPSVKTSSTTGDSVSPRSLEDQMVFFDEAGNLTMRTKSAQPTEIPSGVGADGEVVFNPGPRVEPINPEVGATSVKPSTEANPSITPSEVNNVPGRFIEAGPGAMVADFTASAPHYRDHRSFASEEQLFESPTPASKPEEGVKGVVESKTQSKPGREDRKNYGGGFGGGDGPTKPNGGTVPASKERSSEFANSRVSEIRESAQVPPLTPLEQIELDKKVAEKKARKVVQYTYRRKRRDGTEVDGSLSLLDDEVVAPINSDGKSEETNGSRSVTGTRIVAVEVGTAVVKTEN